MRKSLFGLVALLLAAIVFMGCPTDGGSSGDAHKELTAGPAVNALASATTADVTFTGASGLTLSAADFAVSSDGTISDVKVDSDTATVTVTFPANDSITAKTYTVSIADASAKIKGDATVTITQAAVRIMLTAGGAVNAPASATTADVTFTGATGLTLSVADFVVSSGTVTGVIVDDETATVTVTFPANTGTTAKTYIVSVASDSTVIKSDGTVTITQAAGQITLIAGPAVNVAASAITADVTFTGALGLTLSVADFAVNTGGTISAVNVTSDTATVSVSFAANTSTTESKTYTVSVASDSAVITGSRTVAIYQAAARIMLTAGPDLEVAASDTSADVTFTGALGLTLSVADFVVSSGTVTGVIVDGNTATVSVSFAVNTSAMESKTYTVSIASGSAVIEGDKAVTITQAGTSGSVDITVGFAGDISISGDDGTNRISRSGDNANKTLTLSADDYTDVVWYVDGYTDSTMVISGNSVTLNAADYAIQPHSITFTGMANGRRYSSRPIPFTVLP